MIQLFKTYIVIILWGAAFAVAINAAIFLYQSGARKERLKNLEVENVQRQKAKQAETAFDHCVTARGLAHCVPDNTWRKD